MNGKVPPHNVEAESACIGSIILDNKSYDVVKSIVDVSDFYEEANRIIFQAIADLKEEARPIDFVTLGNRLKERGELDKIGGAMFLGTITDGVATTVNVDHYARIVKHKAARRQVLYAAKNIVCQAESEVDDDEFFLATQRLSDSISRSTCVTRPDSVFDLGDSVVDLYEKVKNGYTGVKFPWDGLNNCTMGMWPKTITVFVGRPGTGKTMIAVLCGRHAHFVENKRTLIISPEMSREEIAERFFVMDAGVSYTNVMRGTLSNFELDKLKKSVNAHRHESGVWIMDATHDLSPKGMEAAIRYVKPELVAIDSLYLLRFPGDETERTRLALDWTNRTCKKYNFAACCYTQLNRRAEVSESKGGGIRLGTIAFADKLGQDAHAIFALEQDKDMKADKRLKFTLLKVRRGVDEGPITIRWDFDTMDFSEIALEKDEYSDDPIPF